MTAIFTRHRIALLIAAPFVTMGLLASTAWAASHKPIYIHMNGLNDFLPRIVFVRPKQHVTFVNQDQGAHSIHGYQLIGGEHLKDMDKVSIQGTPGPGHPVHTYTVDFKKPGVYYYICTIHAHLVKVYRDPNGGTYYLPARRKGIPGYKGSMSGAIIVTREAALLKENPPIVHKRLLPKFWNNGDVSGQ